MRCMFAFVFSWAAMRAVSGKNSLLPTWSPWVWVLMMVTTGLSVTDRMRSRITGPQPGSLVSTIATPSSITKTPTLPPLNSDRSTGDEPVMT